MYTGNSVIVNIFMRWPILIPVATAIGITTAVVKDPVTPVPEPVPVVAPKVEAPVVIPPSVPTPAPEKKKKG